MPTIARLSNTGIFYANTDAPVNQFLDNGFNEITTNQFKVGSSYIFVSELDEITQTSVPLRIQSNRVVVSNIFNEIDEFYTTSTPILVNYLVIAGGGGGGSAGNDSGGGGAGGYRCSVAGELSGRNSPAENPLTLTTIQNYTVQVGAGGNAGFNGNNSVFHTITSIGGGRGGAGNGSSPPEPGGSGGGGGTIGLPGGNTGTEGQGFEGGAYSIEAGGGGGAGGVGLPGNRASGSSNGGIGIASSITGVSVYRGGGGGGGNDVAGTGFGGLGGGGNGVQSGFGGTGTPNTGGGGGGSGAGGSNGGAGGSGIVILSYPSIYTITLSAGLTGTTQTVGSNNVTSITAGTGTVSWN